MVSLCSHLFWPKDNPPVPVDGEEVVAPVQRYSDCDRVLECMQRSLKIASVCNPNIFVEILDRWAIYSLYVILIVDEMNLYVVLINLAYVHTDTFSILRTTIL
jgi:hypothetical protein